MKKIICILVALTTVLTFITTEKSENAIIVYSCMEQFRNDELQEQLNEGMEIERSRSAKANSSYYMLKRSSVPTVIAECGFLSNGEEAVLLTNEKYQEKLAWNLYLGILAYFNTD